MGDFLVSTESDIVKGYGDDLFGFEPAGCLFEDVISEIGGGISECRVAGERRLACGDERWAFGDVVYVVDGVAATLVEEGGEDPGCRCP